MRRLWQYLLALLPLACTPGLLFALAEGVISFGGGEKDIVLIFPYTIWALVFFVSAAVMITKHCDIKHWLTRSALISVGCLVGLGLVAYALSWLGIA